jgi:two-component system OmpR family response regulator
VVSAHDLRRVMARTEGLPAGSPAWAPLVLAFGRGEQLRGAFLAGCDDYLREPWEPDELAMRLERLARRREERRAAGGWELTGRRMRLPDGREVELSAHEAVVAGLLFANRGAVVSRRALSVALWGRPPSRPSRAVDMHVSALRRKLGRDSISCVRGQGYVVD